jgi:DNA-3-methyladenine glycosylase
VNVVTERPEWANGVLLRAVALPNEPERIAAGPGLLARRFGIDRGCDGLSVCADGDLWLAPRPVELTHPALVTTTRIGISQGENLPLRWYLQASRSVSKRARGDRSPKLAEAFCAGSLCS